MNEQLCDRFPWRNSLLTEPLLNSGMYRDGGSDPVAWDPSVVMRLRNVELIYRIKAVTAGREGQQRTSTANYCESRRDRGVRLRG